MEKNTNKKFIKKNPHKKLLDKNYFRQKKIMKKINYKKKIHK